MNSTNHKFKLSQLTPTQLWLYRILNKIEPHISSDTTEVDWMPEEVVEMIIAGGNYSEYFAQWMNKLMEVAIEVENAVFKPKNISVILRAMDIGEAAGLAIVPHNMIIINPWYLLAYPQEVIKETLPHEFTHLICAHEFSSLDHDDNFKTRMEQVFNVAFRNFDDIFPLHRNKIVENTIQNMIGVLKVTKFMIN